MNEPTQIPTGADIRLEMKQNAEYLSECDAARALQAGEISALECQLEDLLAKAEAAKNQPGDALVAADEWRRYDRAAVIVRPRLEAAKAHLKEMPTGYQPGFIKHSLISALKAKLSAVMSGRKSFLFDFYKQRAIPVNPDFIPYWNAEDSLKPLRQMVAMLEDHSARMDTIERGIEMLDAHFD